MQTGVTLWFTGLSGSGKTTLSRCVEQQLKRMGVATETLDGDILRDQIFRGLGFSKEDRSLNIRTAAYLAQLLTRHGVIVLASFISPYRDMREQCRQRIGPFLEVYVKCSWEECARRDTKGLYRKALSGEIKHFTGLTDPYEEPLHPELIVDTENTSEEQCTEQIIAYLTKHGYIGRADSHA
ncbi:MULTISPECIES: adenylyl-sulfate kinase [Paenibacillus]|uniref:Adenylyl-sulfate kinase n=1 Tax=Paenibacillus pabuli TaxID=1472 RepID=A0A855YGV6_9BACL|nr:MULTISPECIES: adenylyl-sulfate kinase [Paenibacillus]PWW45010.1 adenylylsulfate kinase [Paenibacillus pabuli]PXW11346.1 adenylylsulfate kinase [Paenibacillus taichungensis]RAI93598.1 adenylylsulfate kinase [Paenibacillus pabuli]